MFYLLLVFFMPGPGVPIGTALASASKTIPTALVLVEVLVTNLLLFAVRTPLVRDTFNFHQGFAAWLDSLWGSSLGWSVLKGLESLCCSTWTVRIKGLRLDNRGFSHSSLSVSLQTVHRGTGGTRLQSLVLLRHQQHGCPFGFRACPDLHVWLRCGDYVRGLPLHRIGTMLPSPTGVARACACQGF